MKKMWGENHYPPLLIFSSLVSPYPPLQISIFIGFTLSPTPHFYSHWFNPVHLSLFILSLVSPYPLLLNSAHFGFTLSTSPWFYSHRFYTIPLSLFTLSLVLHFPLFFISNQICFSPLF